MHSCIVLGKCHRSHIFQSLSDVIRFIMRQKGYTIIDYTDNYVGVGVPSVASASLLNLMSELSLTVSEKKLIAPSTQVRYLGIMIDTVKGTIAIPPETLDMINDTVCLWLSKSVVLKHQLQSILVLLLYVT